MSVKRIAALAAWVVTIVGSAQPARADEKTACVDAHIEGQRLRDAGKLRAARQKFVACGAQSCPGPVSRECADWLHELDGLLPTVLVVARDATGQETADVAVRVDGEVVAPRLTGMPFAVDPGEHTFRFVWGDGHAREQRFLVTLGDKNRRIVVDYGEAAPAAPAAASAPPLAIAPVPPPPTRDDGSLRVPTASIALGGVGVLGLGSFAVLGVDALSRAHHLRSTCAPTCGPDESSTMRREALIADVSLGVGVVAIGAAIWVFLASRSEPSPARAAVIRSFPSAGAAGCGARCD